MSLNVANCHRCGKIYVKNIHGMCPNCIKDIELQYDKCLKYMRENRDCNINELSDATGVSVRQIAKFIREGRITIKNHENMFYHCEICDTPIKEHALCEPCRIRLLKEKADLAEDEQRKLERENNDKKASFMIKDRLKDRLK